MKIVKITILVDKGSSDCIMLHTDLPSTMPVLCSDNASFSTNVACGGGIDYAEEHFPGVPVHVMDVGVR